VDADHLRKSDLFCVFENELANAFEHDFECSLDEEALNYLFQ